MGGGAVVRDEGQHTESFVNQAQMFKYLPKWVALSENGLSRGAAWSG